MANRVTAADFKLMNSSSEFVNKLNRALDYLQNRDQRIGDILKMAADKGMRVMNNPPDNMMVDAEDRGTTAYAGQTDIALWNPDAAILVRNGGVVTGIQSAADGLLHEVFHSLDPQQIANAQIPMSQYENVGEYVAVTIESAVNQWIGEPGRDSHDGAPVWTQDPTLHAFTNEDGGIQLTWMGDNGTMTYGPQIAIGIPEWNDLQAYGRAAASYDGRDPYDTGGMYVDDDVPYGGGHGTTGSQHGSNGSGHDTSGNNGHDNGPLTSNGGGGWQPWDGTINGDGSHNPATDPRAPHNSSHDHDLVAHSGNQSAFVAATAIKHGLAAGFDAGEPSSDRPDGGIDDGPVTVKYRREAVGQPVSAAGDSVYLSVQTANGVMVHYVDTGVTAGVETVEHIGDESYAVKHRDALAELGIPPLLHPAIIEQHMYGPGAENRDLYDNGSEFFDAGAFPFHFNTRASNGSMPLPKLGDVQLNYSRDVGSAGIHASSTHTLVK